MLVISKENCPKCVEVKNYLLYHGIEFTEIHVLENTQEIKMAREIIKNLGGMQFPLVVQDGKFWFGLDIIGELQPTSQEIKEEIPEKANDIRENSPVFAWGVDKNGKSGSW